LMEFAATIPGHEKLNGGGPKQLLRSALRGWLPDEILDAPKRGFGLDLSHWLRSEMLELLRDTVCDSVARRGYFRPSYVKRLVDIHLSGRADHSQRLWALIMFELWHREFIDRRPAP
jgi:asparagine synthase (glutamine-hydrolysing)